jgi:hypothetical protein
MEQKDQKEICNANFESGKDERKKEYQRTLTEGDGFSTIDLPPVLIGHLT